MMLRVGWEPDFGGYLEERIRTVVNQTYYGGDNRTYVPPPPGAFPYHHYYDFSIRYSRPWEGLTVGGEVFAGRDVYGKSFSRLSGFVRYGGDARTRDNGAAGDSDDDEAADEVNHHGAEVFVDAGANANEVKINLNEVLINGVAVQQTSTTPLNFGPHFAVGARRAVSDTNDLGARVEFDQIDDHLLIGLRASIIVIDSTAPSRLVCSAGLPGTIWRRRRRRCTQASAGVGEISCRNGIWIWIFATRKMWRATTCWPPIPRDCARTASIRSRALHCILSRHF